MIIRYRTTKTLEASSLNNRGYERSEHPRMSASIGIDPKGVALSE